MSHLGPLSDPTEGEAGRATGPYIYIYIYIFIIMFFDFVCYPRAIVVFVTLKRDREP